MNGETRADTHDAMLLDVEQAAYITGWRHGRAASITAVRLRGWGELVIAFALGALAVWVLA